ncbi:hypothetical protein PRK78_005927 [Emydomyces testavorans]|uniref:Uncharacterized protein n=1 Tax=Emydomyces testavorans TaxID=2070801 RepID=A0AAF0DN50_9EURO|nr:hypothetical protein PRK78_005927 [Emydomyces testavorans]
MFLLPYALALSTAILTLWGTFAPVPYTDIHPADSFARRLLQSAKSVLLVRGVMEGAELGIHYLNPNPCKVHPWRVHTTERARAAAELARLYTAYTDNLDMDLAAMQNASVPLPSRTVPVPSRVVTLESDSYKVGSQSDSDLQWGQAICIFITLFFSLASGLSLVLMKAHKSGVMAKTLDSCLASGSRVVSVSVSATSGDLLEGSSKVTDFVAGMIGLSSTSTSTESLVNDSLVESAANADGNRLPCWDLIPYTGNFSLVNKVVPTVTVSAPTEKKTEENRLVKEDGGSIRSGELWFHPVLAQELVKQLDSLTQPRQEQGVMVTSNTELAVSTTVNLATIPEEHVEPPTVVPSSESSPTVPPPEEQSEPEPEPQPTIPEASLEVPATTVEVQQGPPQEQQPAVQPEQDDSDGDPQAESNQEAGEAGSEPRRKRRNRPGRRARVRKGVAKLKAAQDEVIGRVEAEMQAAEAQASANPS